MSNARLTAITIDRYKSFHAPTRVDLAALTVILGRNNSGKSSMIQSLLLLKQTLVDPRPDVMLRLEGMVDAFNLRELTSGWPAAADEVEGPTIALEWECEVNARAILPNEVDLINLSKHSGVNWLSNPQSAHLLRSSIVLKLIELRGSAQISSIELRSKHMTSGKEGATETVLRIDLRTQPWSCTWDGKEAKRIAVDLDNFIPYLRIDKSAVGPRSAQRAYHNAYLVLFEPALEALKKTLRDLHYLGATRMPPPSLFKPATADPGEIGASGEFAAQLLHRRRRDVVHFLPPMQLNHESIETPANIRALPLEDAVNETMRSLSIESPLEIRDIEQVGFRLMFGNASLSHVGRGLGSLLPLVELGLFADPLRFTGVVGEMTQADYATACGAFGHIVLEEPEAHLHPKVASRLAHWLVSLAQSNRRVMVETHSDHLVRRLRGLAARAGAGSALESWLLENVSVVSVEQDADGKSTVTTSKLTREGGMEEAWPTDFMDEASDEESAIYYAQLEKRPKSLARSPVEMVEGEEPDADSAP